MSTDGSEIIEIDATDPAALCGLVDIVDNAITAARLGGPPPEGMVAGMSPDGIESGAQICTPEQSVLGTEFVAELGPAANLPSLKTDMTATFGSNAPLTPTSAFNLSAPEYTG